MGISNNKKNGDADQGWKYANVGFEFAGSVGLFSLIGYFVDKHWGIDPVGVVTGSITGVVVGFYLLVKEVLMSNSSNSGKFKDESGKSDHTP
jgi:F0F1-type ATP synthase assembly protein I